MVMICSWISIDLAFIRSRQRLAINREIERKFNDVPQRKGKWAQDAEFIAEKLGIDVSELPSNQE